MSFYHPLLCLLDGTGMGETRTGFHETMAPYNSMPAARRLLRANGVPQEAVGETEASDRCDLVISLLSWGFHYPVDAYLDIAKTVLAPDGRLMLDLRKDTGGLEALQKDFELVGVLPPRSKADRVCFKRRGENG